MVLLVGPPETGKTLLARMDGFKTNKGVIIMVATTRPEILDLALLLPGRFDRQVLVDRPDINGLEAVITIGRLHWLLCRNMIALGKKLGFEAKREPGSGDNELVIHLGTDHSTAS